MFSLRNLLILFIVASLVTAGWRVYSNIKDSGRQEVVAEVQVQNQKLDENVREVNENVTRHVTIETHRIERQSREVEEVINDQPSERLSSVSRARLERVREQQRAVSETDSEAN